MQPVQEHPATFIITPGNRSPGVEKDVVPGTEQVITSFHHMDWYCLKVIPQEQTLYCHSCGGSGKWYTGDRCPRCTGTGIYRKNILYEFTFEVADKYYVWHQPRIMVDWEVKLTTYTNTDFVPRGGAKRLSGDQTSAYYILMVNTFLLRNGVDQSELPDFPGFYQSLSQDWVIIKSKIHSRSCPAHKYWRRLREARKLAWGYIKNGKIPGYQKIAKDEIPF